MTEVSTELSELLPEASLKVGQVRIPNWLANQFRDQSSLSHAKVETTPKLFLEAFLSENPDKIVEMVSLVGPILSGLSPSDLKSVIPTILDSEDEVWTHALVEAQHWFSNQVVWGWREDPLERPEGYEMARANGFFQSCLELTRRFLVNGGNPQVTEDIKEFLKDSGEVIVGLDNKSELKVRWPGWEIYQPRKQLETIHLKRIKRSQRSDETRDEFFGRILANVAEETIIQMCIPDKEDYFQGTTFQSEKQTSQAIVAQDPKNQPELLLLKLMLGDLSCESQTAGMLRKISSIGNSLGFLRKKTKVDRFMEDFADRARVAKNIVKEVS